MKIRTDFVTNSSSSSFVVEVEVELSDHSRYVFETKPTDEGANSNFNCSGADVAGTGSVDELCDLLQKSMSGTGKTKIKGFVGEIRENVDNFSDIDTVTLRRIWISMGESSGLTVVNDGPLQEFALALTKAKGTEADAARDAFVDYLETAEVYIQGGWSDEWPSGFADHKAIPRYKWDHLGLTPEALAKKIVADKINHNDLAVETVVVDLQAKTVTESAHFIMDSKESGIGKKPAKRSNKFFTNTIIATCSDYEVRQSVPIIALIPDYTTECDPLDYVIYKDSLPKVAVSIKTAENAKSKTFKAVIPACVSISLEHIVFDEKKDCTDVKVISKLNEALFADVFKTYVIQNAAAKEVPTPASGDGHSVKVKFGDARSYEYNALGGIKVGDVVLVGGSKRGQRGMVVAVTGDQTFPGYYNVETVLHF